MKKFQIVYLEDDQELCDMFTELVTSNDIAVLAFTDADNAVDFVNKNLPDLIFIDYRIRHLKGDTIAKRMPASIDKILITGELEVQSEYPFAMIIHKPMPPEDLINMIENRRIQGTFGVAKKTS